jgi:hypothetical protein
VLISINVTSKARLGSGARQRNRLARCGNQGRLAVFIFCALHLGCSARVVERPDASGAGSSGALDSAGSSGSSAGEFAGAPAASGGTSGAGAFVPSKDCAASPAASVDYSTRDELETLLVRRWQRCIEPQIPGEEVGVEFTSDGKYYPLYLDAEGNVATRTGADYEKHWAYSPPGESDPISHAPSSRGVLELDGIITDPPRFTRSPQQLRIMFTPVLARYTPLE